MMRDFMICWGYHQHMRRIAGKNADGWINWRMWLRHPNYVAKYIVEGA